MRQFDERELERFFQSLKAEKSDDRPLEQLLESLGHAVNQFGNIEHWHTDKANRELVPEGQRPCPICGSTMQTDAEYDVTVDVCPNHGVWLDGKELAGIIENYKNSSVQSFRLRTAYLKGYEDGCRARSSG